jgi:hypothetical protein
MENAAPYLIFFVIWTLVGAVSLWRGIAPRVRGTGEINSRHTATGVILLVWGIAMLLIPRQGEEWLSVVVICGAGVMMNFIGVSSIRDARRCTVHVSAHIVRHRVTRSKHGRHYYAVLRYRHEGQEYESECFQSLTHWQVRDEYPEGSNVWAYICPEKPTLCAFDNTVRVSYVISIAVGIALIVGGIGFALGGGF